MRVILYFILFGGFLVTVTILDRLTNIPHSKTEKARKSSNMIIINAKDPQSLSMGNEENTYVKPIKKINMASQETDSWKKTAAPQENNIKNFASDKKGVSAGEKDAKKKDDELKEKIYKGAEYSVFLFQSGKLQFVDKIWFDFSNPPAKKLKKEIFNTIWKEPGCCLWKKGENVLVVLGSNLHNKIGSKKFPVK